MKRGFLNTARYKRVIEEVYAPASPPVSEARRPVKSSSPSRPAQGGDDRPGATDVEKTILEEVYADGKVVAVRVTRASTDGEAVASAQSATTTVQKMYADGKVVAVRVLRSTEGEDEKGARAKPLAKGLKEKGIAGAVDNGGAVPTLPYGDPSQGFVPPRSMQPNPRGWGRHPDEEYFHIAPQGFCLPGKKRAVFRLWPRDPNGKPLLPSNELRGTLSPDGYPWGATLFDIYSVNRSPNVPSFIAIMTGSAIYEAMKVLGELDYAAPEIEWAKSEGLPRIEGAADTEELIRCIDTKLQLSGDFDVLSQDTEGEDGSDDEDNDSVSTHEAEIKYHDTDSESIFIPPPPTIPVTSPFHPSHYPKPWPFTPFEHSNSILLQERIPLHLLPRTLYVHDPFNLLPAHEPNFHHTSWTSRPDIVRTYDLHLSQSTRTEYEEATRKAEELEEFKSRSLIVMRYKRTKEQIKNHEPIIEVPLPPYLRRIKQVEESHLYLSPVAKVGNGNHSIVYKGEWELPRDLFMKQRICRLCFKESVDREIQRMKDTGRWEKMLRAASCGPNGFSGRQPSQAELDEVNYPPKPESDGEIIEREITCVVPPNVDPWEIVIRVDEDHRWAKFMNEKQLNTAQLHFAGPEDVDQSTGGPGVVVIRINPPFTYESQKSCTHEPHPPAPRTAIFTVIAKLSIEGDHHIVREARNYQMFPEHFFHHYNGYTIISQLHTIVPVGAVIPQFYGYYTPREYSGQPPYLSPILLLEHCGKPIKPEKFTLEEQEECVSLLLRFQKAGWLHESFAPRNFLVQKGKPTEFPLTRLCKPERSFRLIDFGRSRMYKYVEEKRREEMEALSVFQRLAWNNNMNFTMGGR